MFKHFLWLQLLNSSKYSSKSVWWNIPTFLQIVGKQLSNSNCFRWGDPLDAGHLGDGDASHLPAIRKGPVENHRHPKGPLQLENLSRNPSFFSEVSDDVWKYMVFLKSPGQELQYCDMVYERYWDELNHRNGKPINHPWPYGITWLWYPNKKLMFYECLWWHFSVEMAMRGWFALFQSQFCSYIHI